MSKTDGKKYYVLVCYDCNLDFVCPPFTGSNYNCPKCADSISVEKEREIFVDRFFIHRRPWTEREDQTLIYGRKNGTTFREIGETLKRTKNACKRRYYQLRDEGAIK